MCLALATDLTIILTFTVRVPDSIRETSLLEGWFGHCALIAMLALPQIVLALIGGNLATRYGLTIAIKNR
jgi:hypothetical protein